MNFYDDAHQMTRESMDNMLKSMSVMTRGFQQIATQSAEFAKSNYEKQAAMVEQIAQVRSFEKTMELQNSYAREAYQDWISQANRLGEIYSETAREANEPFEKTVSKASDMGARTAAAAADKAGDATEKMQKNVEAAAKKAA